MKNKLIPYVLVGPAIILFLIFVGMPILFTIIGSITFRNTPNFLVNINKLTTDKMIIKSIYNTVIILLFYLLLKLPVSIYLGYLISTMNKLKRTILTIFFIPTTIGMFAYGVIFRFMFSSNGIINSIFFNETPFLDNEIWTKFIVALALFIANFGGMTLLILLSIQNNISKDLFDLSKIDGMNTYQKLRFIILPVLRPIITLITIFAVLEVVSLISLPMQLSQGGPNKATVTIGYYIYKLAFEYGEFSYASFVSLIMMSLVIWLIIIPKSMRKRGFTYEDY